MTDRRIIGQLAVGQTLIWATVYYVFPAMLLTWEGELGFSRAALTGAISVAILISALASPISGRLIDAGRGAHVMAGAALLAAVALFGLSRVSSLLGFYALWTLLGLAMAGGLYEPCFAMVTRAKGPAARRAITSITLIAGFAGTISFPAVHFLTEQIGWRPTLVLFGLVAGGLVAPIFWQSARSLEAMARPEPMSAVDQTGRGFLRHPVFWLLAGAFGLLALVQGATIQHLLPILDQRSFDPMFAVLAISVIGPSQVAGRVAMDIAARALATHWLLTLAFGLLGLAVLFLLLGGQSEVTVICAVALFGAAWGTVSILRPVTTRDLLGGRSFGQKSGTLAMVFWIGNASAPFLATLVWRGAGYDVLLALLCGLCGLGYICYSQARKSVGVADGSP